MCLMMGIQTVFVYTDCLLSINPCFVWLSVKIEYLHICIVIILSPGENRCLMVMFFSFLCRLYPTVSIFLSPHFTVFSTPVGQRCLKLQVRDFIFFYVSCLNCISQYNCLYSLWQLEESLQGKVIRRSI